jgi:pyruvate dehydrogenase E2 component (dihydrolipoamide acetyltransferase)
VRRLARDLGVDLATLPGSGPGGTISRADVESAAQAAAQVAAEAAPAADVEQIPVRSVRRATADAVTRSAFTAPHVTEHLTVDVTASVELLARLRTRPEAADARLSPLTLAARAMCVAVRRTPIINARWEETPGGEAVITVPTAVHLAVATATPRGLLVPVVRDAHTLDVPALGRAVAAAAERARAGTATPAELTGGTLAITNVGVFGVDAGTPILVPGQSAILALGQVARRPWVVGTGADEAVVPRWVVTLSLSFDHRVVDGEQGSRFLADVGGLLADPALALAW